jgi:hypothetical protein
MSNAIPGGGGAPAPYSPPPQVMTADAQAQLAQAQLQASEGGYRGAHPVAAFFHFSFKFFSILIYLLAGVFGMSYMYEFITVCLLLAADFWATKNVTGRLLVALRWWNHVREDGESEWVFESHPLADKVNKFDKYFFWFLTLGAPTVWWLLVLFSLTSVGKLPLTLLGAILGTANGVGFIKCSRDAKKKATNFLVKQAMKNPDAVASAATTTAQTATVVAGVAQAQAAKQQGGAR